MTEKKKQTKPIKKAEETEKRVEVEGEELVIEELEKVSGGAYKAPYVPIGYGE
jgi:hypothetical protein